MTTVNPDPLRGSVPDMSNGIPAPLWAGANQAARDMLVAEYRRQLGEVASQRKVAEAERLESLRRYLARPEAVTEPAAQLRHLLLATADAARALAMTLPADGGPSPDADAS